MEQDKFNPRLPESELTLSPRFVEEQYGHLPADERPITGPVVDVRNVLQENREYVEDLENRIREKRVKTRNWVKENFPGYTAVWLTRPYFWQENPHLQEFAAKWMADVILAVYGTAYPLPNKDPEFNLDGLRNGSLLPYFGLIVPKEFAGDCSVDFHKLLANGKINPETFIPVTTSAILLDTNGFAEIGRNANRGYKDEKFSGFEGGPTTLERVYDWLRNRHRLLERIYALVSDVRAAQAHGDSPSAAGVQTLILRDLGMKIVYTAPLYNVNGFEPFISVRRPRSFDDWRVVNSEKTIYTCSGPHLPLLQALWRHQLGTYPNLLVDETNLPPHSLAMPRPHGKNVYSVLDVYDEEKVRMLGFDESRQVTRLEEAIDYLVATSPVVVAKVEAETQESVATQRLLMENGFVICGIEPGYDFEYLEKINGNWVVRRYRSPVHIYLCRLGTITPADVVQPFFLDPAKTEGRNFGYDENLRELLIKTHLRILGAEN